MSIIIRFCKATWAAVLATAMDNEQLVRRQRIGIRNKELTRRWFRWHVGIE